MPSDLSGGGRESPGIGLRRQAREHVLQIGIRIRPARCADWIRLMIAAAFRPPCSELANSQFERQAAQGRNWCLSLGGSFGSLSAR